MLDSKDLEILQTMMTQIVAASEVRMSAKIEESIAASEARMSTKIEESIAASETRMSTKIEETRSMMMAYFESAIEPKIDLVAEGYELLQKTKAPISCVEQLEDEVSTLRSAIKIVSSDIAELKKAQ